MLNIKEQMKIDLIKDINEITAFIDYLSCDNDYKYSESKETMYKIAWNLRKDLEIRLRNVDD